MAGELRVSFVRPDDLLTLDVQGVNLRLETEGTPRLVHDDPQAEALLVVHLPPQTIVEEAYVEQPPPAQPAPEQKLDPAAGDVKLTDRPSGPAKPRPPGQSAYRLGEPSRLVFRVPLGVEVPYTSAGLLDWSALQLVVTSAADTAAGSRPDDPAVRRPTDHETALELPFRLTMSPSSRTAWEHSAQAVTHRGRTELWHTRLVNAPGDHGAVPLRAVWSPDFRLDEDLPSPDSSGLGDGVVTAMSVSDRHQIVVLTSAFDGYAVNVLRGFTPSPVQATLLMLSPLGGWLRSEGRWDPPFRATRRRRIDPVQVGGIGAVLREGGRAVDVPVREAPEVAGNLAPDVRAALGAVVEPAGVDVLRPGVGIGVGLPFFTLGQQLDLSQWTHVAAQGRDHYVRLVYEGRLADLGHRASLVKVTERRFETVEGSNDPVAFLRQYFYVVVREPVRAYTRRGMPWKTVRLTTLVTPHIDYPYALPDYTPPGAIPGSDRSFWVTVGRQDFKFHGVATDAAGRTVDFQKALVFVPNSETSVAAVAAATRSGAGRQRMVALVPNQRVAFAEPDPAADHDNTSFVTEALMLEPRDTSSKDAFFDPALYQAQVHVPSVEQLTGSSTATHIAHAADWLAGGFEDAANATGVFARVVDLDETTGALTDAGTQAAFQAAQAGGVATPQLAITTLTRDLGPLGGKLADALTNTFDPTTVFDTAATLFGVFPLTKLVRAGSADGNAPTMQVRLDGTTVVAVLHWATTVDEHGVGIVTFRPKDGTELTVDVEVRRPVGGDPTTKVHGVLGPFDLEFLSSLIVHFASFVFDSRTGTKTNVDVSLKPDPPVEFVGDLEFVDDLRKLIPPGVFGDGVSIDLVQSPLGVRASLTIALPPATVGVFALKNIAFSAGLTVPFLDGKPVAEFGFARRDAPFLLAVLIFGGGGFFHVQVDTDGLRSLEAAFEFGATAALDIGVASGEVHVMAGIYFGVTKKQIGGQDRMIAQLTGYLRCGGSLSVLGLVRISVEFCLSFTYYPLPVGKAKGRATLTVEIEVLCFSKSVELTVEKSFGGHGADPTFADMLPSADLWAEYAGAFA